MFKFTTKGKIIIYLVAYLSLIVFPIIAYYVGWIGWDVRTGVKGALFTFVFWLVSGSAVFFMMGDIHMFPASLPFLFCLVYPFLPDYIPGPVEDAVVVAVGAILTFILWKRRKPATPSWLLAPMLLTAVYTLFGALIPTMIDEAVVYILLVSLVIFGLLTGLTFKAVYIHLFSIIVFLINVIEKLITNIKKNLAKKAPSVPHLEKSEPLKLSEMEDVEDQPCAPGVAQAEGQQV
ncbi:MAG: hypothetical protein ABSE06_20875 [Anaerolineaceae bacterium]|jgi:hypothetical protein